MKINEFKNKIVDINFNISRISRADYLNLDDTHQIWDEINEEIEIIIHDTVCAFLALSYCVCHNRSEEELNRLTNLWIEKFKLLESIKIESVLSDYASMLGSSFYCSETYSMNL